VGIARGRDPDQRARFGIALAELQEILRQVLRQDGEIGRTNPGASPEVWPEWLLRLIASRAARLASITSGLSRRIVAVAIAGSLSVLGVKRSAHFIIKPPWEKRTAATMLRAPVPRRAGNAKPNPVETAAKIAFVNGQMPAKKPAQGSARGHGKFQ
jgi:hypothetical protein